MNPHDERRPTKVVPVYVPEVIMLGRTLWLLIIVAICMACFFIYRTLLK